MTFSHTLEISAPEEVWRRWTEVETWHEWDTEVKEASLEGNFELGVKGTLAPKTGPETSFTITEFTPEQSYTFTTNLPLAELHVKRYFSRNRAAFTREVSFTGTLAPLFSFLLGRRFKEVLPEVMTNLRELTESKRVASSARSGKGDYE